MCAIHQHYFKGIKWTSKEINFFRANIFYTRASHTGKFNIKWEFLQDFIIQLLTSETFVPGKYCNYQIKQAPSLITNS